MKLIGSLTSPYVRKVRIVMVEKKIDYQFVLEDPWAPDSHVRDANPLGKIPCLIMEDGEAMFDSRVICEYLDTLTPVGKLIPPSGRERAEVRCWEALADGVLDATVLIRLEGKFHEPEHRSQAWLDRQRDKIETSLHAMANGLGERPWCAGNHLSLADLAVGCALGYLDLRAPDIAWRASHPALGKYFERLSQRQSFIDTQPPQA
ncbi:glutathione S-transferase [Pandoraea thiooxydans]|uniref:Glutathione S-transferase n=1 Tax=Pandoraea thiooxydans TaxID=445709 RepID=A0A0G3EZ77_9BURK|nr:glutathione S-transferase [Pandoraea thiooxydans]AKJ70021.1 glutathione S-transferase [Pandoraea thiooxydans]APR93429.1 glutathione S-transferase [Pandoraea thiooxydans]